MSRGFKSILTVASTLALCATIQAGCSSTDPDAANADKNKGQKNQATGAAEGGTAATQESSASNQASGQGPVVNPHPSGSNQGTSGEPGNAAPNPGEIKEDQTGPNPGSGDETNENVSLLESARGANSVRPASTTDLNLTSESGQTMFQGNWKSGRSAEQDTLLEALTIGLEGDLTKVENSNLDGSSKDLAIKLAEQVRIDSSQGSASSPVNEALALKGELENPQELVMRVDSSSINVKGDYNEEQEEGGQWTASYTVIGATGNALQVSANRKTGPETVEIFFVNQNQIWVPRGEGEGTVYNRNQ